MRLWRVCKEANRPFPSVSPDDVIDYMVMEALAVKDQEEQQEAQKKAERDAWRKEHRQMGR